MSKRLETPVRRRIAGLLGAAVLVAVLPISTQGAGRNEERVSGAPDEQATPLPIPSPVLEDGADRSAVARAASVGSSGWLAFADGSDGSTAGRGSAELFREWAASTKPALPPVEERLPSGVVKLHHRGHYLSTLYATIDEQGRLRYSHQPPGEDSTAVEAEETSGSEAGSGAESSPEGGAR